MKRITTINEKFQREPSRESELKIKSLELMCQTQLHLVTVSSFNFTSKIFCVAFTYFCLFSRNTTFMYTSGPSATLCIGSQHRSFN